MKRTFVIEPVSTLRCEIPEHFRSADESEASQAERHFIRVFGWVGFGQVGDERKMETGFTALDCSTYIKGVIV